MVQALTLKLLGAVVAMLAFIAAADFFFQYQQWYERQKMSFQEIKEEYKQSEGDPHIKARIRRLREQRMRKRMMAAVPEASVVITNPTHYAVALKYDRGDNAPLCVAKGLDLIALKIREVAEAHSRAGGGKPAAGAGAACHGRDRPGNPAGTLPGRRRNHRLCHEAAGGGGGRRYRHARPCAGHPRLASLVLASQDVDGRVKPGHDERWIKARQLAL